ncbi:ABC transporter permease [Streptomyces sp. NBC_00078]|uniref:ABC transporter permease n=1 Tax=unclassified Streptomyces TaxID=2593676 RepID=UPI00224FBDE2|nr:ABC transporter permease [Streptomyces sp. NBC_00078]MCX5422394.1 ABC transporter permease [Streptomyces sp. NBC_00078]
MKQHASDRVPPVSYRLSPARAVGVVARREINTRLRTKAFVVSTLGLLLGLAVYAFVVVFVGDDTRTVALDRQTAALRPALTAAAEGRGEELRFRQAAGRAEAERQLRDGDADAYLHGSPGGSGRLGILVERDLNPGLERVVRAAAQQDAVARELERSGLDQERLSASAERAAPRTEALEATSVRPDRLVLGLAASGLLYLFLVLFGIVVAQGVVEEKSSRVVELLLSAVRPWQLLIGKIVGVGVVGLVQLVVVGGAAVTAARAAGLLDLPDAGVGTLVSVALWYVLGFFLFATLLAAAAARVSRQEEVQSVVQPVMLLMAAPFILGITLLTKDPANPLIEALSLVPPFSPVLMPARIAMGTAPLWQPALAALLTLAAVAVLVRLGGRVYSNSVLRNGARVRLREALSRTS